MRLLVDGRGGIGWRKVSRNDCSQPSFSFRLTSFRRQDSKPRHFSVPGSVLTETVEFCSVTHVLVRAICSGIYVLVYTVYASTAPHRAEPSSSCLSLCCVSALATVLKITLAYGTNVSIFHLSISVIPLVCVLILPRSTIKISSKPLGKLSSSGWNKKEEKVMEAMRWSEQNVSPKDGSPGAPTIKNHSVTHFNGYLYCFGGYDGRRNHLTLLLYSIREQRWIRPHHVGGSGGAGDQPPFLGDTSVLVTGNPPPGRNGHSATLATDPDDDDNGRIIIIGGWLGTGPLAASDMHVLDISNGGRQLRWYQPAVKGTPPGPCNMHSADYVSARREVYVFRGGNGREYLNDLHALSTDTLTWREVETTGAVPQQRANHSSAILDETGELFIFGGW